MLDYKVRVVNETGMPQSLRFLPEFNREPWKSLMTLSGTLDIEVLEGNVLSRGLGCGILGVEFGKGRGFMKDLRVAFVGTSSIMELIIAAAKDCERLLPRVVYSRSAERGQAFAEKMGLPETCFDYEAMVKRKDLDLIYIASPNFLHFSQALLALEHKKHVILEKPAVLSREEAQRLYAAAIPEAAAI